MPLSMDERKKVDDEEKAWLTVNGISTEVLQTKFDFSLPSMRKVYNSYVQKIVVFENSIL